MIQNKIKVAMVTNHFGITGIRSVMMNYCKALNKDRFELTILAGEPIADLYKSDCVSHDIRLIVLPPRHRESIKHYLAMWVEIKKGNFDIVHVHGSSFMMAVESTIAKMEGVKKVV